jgi:hypothetical protein
MIRISRWIDVPYESEAKSNAKAFLCALATLNVFSAARFSLFTSPPCWFSLLRAAAFFSLRKLAGVLVMNLVSSNSKIAFKFKFKFKFKKGVERKRREKPKELQGWMVVAAMHALCCGSTAIQQDCNFWFCS